MPAPAPQGASDLARRALFSQMLRAASREFGLVEAVPKRFALRGWPLDDRVHVATMALCLVALRAPDARVEVFRGADDPPCWSRIVGSARADDVVESLDLRDLIRGLR